MHEWLLILHLINGEVRIAEMSEAQCLTHLERLEEAGSGAAVDKDGTETLIIHAVCAPRDVAEE